jgi:GR25 family glycosyltransferase involved in LPS biosynthesis
MYINKQSKSMKIVIYTHEARINYALKLQQNIPKAIIHLDKKTGHLNAVKDALRLNYQKGCNYILLIEDDVILCDNFIQSVEKAIDANINRCPLVFFSISEKSKEAYDKGYRWIKMKTNAWAQCIAYPEEIIEDLLNYPSVNTKFSDVWLSMYCLINKIDIMQPLPNFVQHKELKSSIGNPITIGGRKRISKIFGTGVKENYNNTYNNPYVSKNNRTLKQYINAYGN